VTTPAALTLRSVVSPALALKVSVPFDPDRCSTAPIGRRTVNGAGVGHEPIWVIALGETLSVKGPGSGVAVDVGVGAAEGVVATRACPRW